MYGRLMEYVGMDCGMRIGLHTKTKSGDDVNWKKTARGGEIANYDHETLGPRKYSRSRF